MITKYTVRLVQPKGTDSHDLFTTNRHGEYFLKFLLNPYVYILSRNTSNAHKRLSLLSHLTFLPSPPPKKNNSSNCAKALGYFHKTWLVFFSYVLVLHFSFVSRFSNLFRLSSTFHHLYTIFFTLFGRL